MAEHVMAWEDSTGRLRAYGPFPNQDALVEWWAPHLAFIDIDKHRTVSFLMLPPLNPDATFAKFQAGKFYHVDEFNDRNTDKFIVVTIYSRQLTLGVGPFGSRVQAESWFVGQGSKYAEAETLILPLLAPTAAPVG